MPDEIAALKRQLLDDIRKQAAVLRQAQVRRDRLIAEAFRAGIPRRQIAEAGEMTPQNVWVIAKREG